MRIKIIQPAGHNARFAANAFADSIGVTRTSKIVDYETKMPLTETLIEAVVSEDGTEAELTWEFDGIVLPPSDPNLFSSFES